MDKLFKENAQCINVYVGTETVLDPIEKNIKFTLLNPIPIKAIVTDLTFAQVQWKMPGIITEGAKEIIIKKNKKSLLEQSVKIDIEGIEYEGWKVNGRLQYRVEGDFVRAYIYRKQV